MPKRGKRIVSFISLVRTLLLLGVVTVANQSFGDPESIVVRNGHHRAIAVIVLMKKSNLPPDTVVGEYDGKPVTAAQLLDWYDSGRLLAYNRAHSPAEAESLASSFDPDRARMASESNPAGGVILTRRQAGENLSPFKYMKQYGSYFERPNCEDLVVRLVAGK